MLLLLFRLGDDTYALDTSRIVEVVPLVAGRGIPQAAAGIAGLFDYRGTIVPLLDLSLLAIGAASRRVMSTRIAIVHYENNMLGLILQNASRIVKKSHADFVSAPVDVPNAPYFGKLAREAEGLIQSVELDELLPPHVREQLFAS